MRKIILWTTGIVVVAPLVIAAFFAFMLFVFYPLQHGWNVQRMDARNDQVWEDAVAQVVTVQTVLQTRDGPQTLTTQIICYEKYLARPFTLKSGPPEAFMGPASIGFQSLQAEFPTGATLDIDLTFLCSTVLRARINDIPMRLENTWMFLVAPELSLYCEFRDVGALRDYVLHTDAGRVGHLVISAVNMQLLRLLASRAEMGSSEVPSISPGFTQRWGQQMRRSDWSDGEACWTDRSGVCSEAMTRYCGTNPR